ncbi:MAG: DUF59 domain-containing protein [Planctomycetes bacterium]|nr:DUF59 domain-containing protein [Planctomycetota bacterium]MCL4731858.1 DUF59 domain-containing protein [Planctomycetota bacterium]
MPPTANPTDPVSQPQGAARLVDPARVTPVAEGAATPPVPDNPLANRGAPGQAPKSLRDSIPQTEPVPPDPSRLPRDAQGNPRNLTFDEARKLKDAVVATLRTIFDPEIPVNIYELGLVYNVSVGVDGAVDIRMTLTSPACPVAGTLPGDVERKLRALDWVTAARVTLVWDPPWTKAMMSEAAKLELNVM